MLRFDPNLRWLFQEMPMIERYGAAAHLGFRGVEVAFPYEYPAKETAMRLADHDLTMVQILSPCDWSKGERGIAALPGREAEFRVSIEVAVSYAAQIGKPLIHTMAGNLDAGADHAACHATFLENIAFAADVAEKEGITIILEPCCTDRFPDYFYHRLDEGISIIKQLGRSNVKLCYDTFHVQSEEGALTHKLKEAFPYIGHMQVGDVPGRQQPGTGEIRFPFLFEQIEALGWSGWIGCEFTPSTPLTADALEWHRPFEVAAAAA